MDIDGYVLSSADSLSLLQAGQGQNSLSGYARSIFYRLTGEKINIELQHLDGSITVRSPNETVDVIDKSEIYKTPGWDNAKIL
jgi:hypothetical protein